MSVLQGKKILLGISGGIAAYKTASLVRLFIKAGAHVQIVMSPAAKEFVTPLTLATLSKNPVYSEFVEPNDTTGVWNNHVELALWADLFLVAPATANTISKMANGICDNLLMACYLSAKCTVFCAPAMDLDMYKHQSTIQNFNKLQDFGNIIIPAESGALASGLSGQGRMAEPENILRFIEDFWLSSLPLLGKNILITAGPTYEAIDPVRYIGNHATGKMGYEIAWEAAQRGAKVFLVSGPSKIEIKHDMIDLIKVNSSDEMYVACQKVFHDVDVFIAAAAVADYKPRQVSEQKIKKNDDKLLIELVKTKDILKSLGEIKKNQFLVGFALETENEIEHAIQKIKNKNLDLIVLNSLNDQGAGFGHDTNKVTFIDKNFNITPMPLKSKIEVAQDIINQICQHFHV